MSVTVSITLPAQLVRRARSKHVVISRVARDSLERIVGGSDLARINDELRDLESRKRILEAARDHALGQRAQEESAASAERDRLAAVAALAEAYWSPKAIVGFPGRPDMARSDAPRSTNLVWVRERIKHQPTLRGSKAEEILDLVVAAKPREESS